MGLFGNKSYDILKDELAELKRSSTAPLDGVRPPSRSASGTATTQQIQSLSIVHRATQIHQTAGKQCSIYGINLDTNERIKASDLDRVVRKPVTKYSFREYVSRSISTMLRHGNGYRLKEYRDGKVERLIPLNASDVTVEIDSADPTTITKFLYQNKQYDPADISHIKYNEVDELPLGLSAFDAANLELKGIYNTRNYTRRWLEENSVPLEGYLKSLYDVDNEEAQALKAAWKEGTRGDEGIAVLPQSTEFVPMYLKPSELQWIDVQKFDAIQLCRLMAVPASLMLVGLEGNSQTYANIEQDWIAYKTYALMALLLPIEEELTSLAPSNIEIRFNTDALLRSDTLTRYQAHAIALGQKPFMSQAEVRDIEDRDPIDIALLTPPAPTQLAPVLPKENNGE